MKSILIFVVAFFLLAMISWAQPCTTPPCPPPDPGEPVPFPYLWILILSGSLLGISGISKFKTNKKN